MRLFISVLITIIIILSFISAHHVLFGFVIVIPPPPSRTLPRVSCLYLLQHQLLHAGLRHADVAQVGKTFEYDDVDRWRWWCQPVTLLPSRTKRSPTMKTWDGDEDYHLPSLLPKTTTTPTTTHTAPKAQTTTPLDRVIQVNVHPTRKPSMVVVDAGQLPLPHSNINSKVIGSLHCLPVGSQLSSNINNANGEAQVVITHPPSFSSALHNSTLDIKLFVPTSPIFLFQDGAHDASMDCTMHRALESQLQSLLKTTTAATQGFSSQHLPNNPLHIFSCKKTCSNQHTIRQRFWPRRTRYAHFHCFCKDTFLLKT